MGLDYGIQTCSWHPGLLHSLGSLIHPKKEHHSLAHKDYSSVGAGLKARDIKYIRISPVFSLGNTEAGLVLGFCVSVASNPRNTEGDWGMSQSIPDNAVRELLTQGCAGLPLSPASHPSLCCHLLLFQLESVNLYHITPKVRLWSSSHHRKTHLALKVNTSSTWWNKSEGPRVSPHVQDITWLQLPALQGLINWSTPRSGS